MDYEKKYREAQKWIESIYSELSHEQQMEAEAFFPELKESEDEKIRKAFDNAIAWLEKQNSNVDNANKEYWRGYREGKQEILDKYSELEKQGEQEPTDKIEPKFKVGDIIINIHYKWDGKHRIREITDGKYIFDGGSYINIKEQDSWELANKVEPKFKVGDLIRLKDGDGLEWTIKEMHHDGYYTIVCEDRDDFIYLDDRWELVGKLVDKIEAKFHEGEWLCENEHNNYARFIQILETVNVQGKERYRISRDIHNDEDVVEVDFVEKYYHKFDIKDAKDGEVLATPNYIYIFNSIDKETETVAFYCLIKKSDKHFSFGDYRIQDEILNSTPATKEQRDTLLKAMTDAGWEFDFEKKELKKISQRMISAEAKEAMYGKPAWSEEDECYMSECIGAIATKDGWSFEEKRKTKHWLKSLKQRIGG